VIISKSGLCMFFRSFPLLSFLFFSFAYVKRRSYLNRLRVVLNQHGFSSLHHCNRTHRSACSGALDLRTPTLSTQAYSRVYSDYYMQ
jgi:hypothetical protein